MRKTEKAIKINIALLVVAVLGITLSCCFTAEQFTVEMVLYDIAIGLFGGTVVAIIFCLHDQAYERRVLRIILKEYKDKIAELLPTDTIPGDNTLTPEKLEQLKALASGYRVALSEFSMDTECDELCGAVAECLTTDAVQLPAAVRKLRQIVVAK